MDIAVNKISKLINDNERVLIENLKNGVLPIQDIATDLETILVRKDPTALPDSSCISTDPSLIKCDNAFRSILLLKYKSEVETGVLKTLKKKLETGMLAPEQLLSQFQKDLKKKMKEFEERPDILKRDEAYKDFRSTIWTLRHPSQPFSFGDGDSDDDIQMVTSREDYHCPLTRAIMTDPYRAPCGHCFSKAILQYVLHQSIDCPVSGCSGRVSRTDLRRDEGLARKIARYKRQLEEQEVDEQIEDME